MSARLGAAAMLLVIGLSGGRVMAARSDLAVTPSGPGTACVGEVITCTLVYTNQGSAKATQVTLTDTLPPEFLVNPLTLANGSRKGNQLTWDLGTVRAGKGGAVSYQVLVTTNAATGQTLSVTNFATISGAETEAITGNNNTLQIILIGESLAATPLVNQTNCPDTTAVFSTVASGSGPFTYEWLKDGTELKGQTDSSLVLQAVTASDAALYTVIVSSGAESVTNSAVLVVNSETTTSPLNNLLRNPGETAIFTTVASGTGPFTYVWRKNGDELPGQTGSSLVLSNLTSEDEGVYTVETSGACNSATSSALLHVNLAPTVSIINPTNESVFLAPAHFTIVANAGDADGTITSVYFSMQTTNLDAGQPDKLLNRYSTGVTNVPVGDYLLTAAVTDNGGLTSISAPVLIHVRSPAPITLLSPVQFNPQTGLFQQTLRVGNLTDEIFQAVRIYVFGLTNGTTVYNASGTNGVPYVQSLTSIPAGGQLDLVIEYYSPLRIAPNPTFQVEVLPTKPSAAPAPPGIPVAVSRGLFLPDHTFLLEFSTATNRFYIVEYSGDLKGWTAAQQPPIAGNGSSVQWIDNGQPKTESAPAMAGQRFYRVILQP